MKGKKESNSNKELDSITCSNCKTVFTDQESKIICCDSCGLWFCISCENVTDACYKFLSSEDAIAITWYCKACKLLAKKAITEERNNCIKQKCMEYTKELKQKMKSIEPIIQRKVDLTELQELQKVNAMLFQLGYPPVLTWDLDGEYPILLTGGVAPGWCTPHLDLGWGATPIQT